MTELMQHMAEEIEKAFEHEARSISGAELDDRSEATNHTLRTAWPVILRALRDANLIA